MDNVHYSVGRADPSQTSEIDQPEATSGSAGSGGNYGCPVCTANTEIEVPFSRTRQNLSRKIVETKRTRRKFAETQFLAEIKEEILV